MTPEEINVLHESGIAKDLNTAISLNTVNQNGQQFR